MSAAMVNSSDPDQEIRNGQRVLVLWLCWILLAVFLFAAGVMTFG